MAGVTRPFFTGNNMKRLLNRHPDVITRYILGAIPFILILVIYVVSSNARLAENPRDKLLPSLNSMALLILLV